jgi:Bardet-Biedl syndrome 9 protein
MSVFQLQDWWAVHVAEDEEFDAGCFGIGNIDNATNGANKIVLGSLQGMLRIYYPSKPGFRVEDLILEENLVKPILQVLVGRFVPGGEQLGIAVLHPRELVVFEVLPQGTKTPHCGSECISD